VNLGALAVNYARVQEFRYDDNNQVTGAVVRDTLSGRPFIVNAAKIVNATGPWVDELRDMDGSKNGKTLRLTKGVHLVFDGSRFPLRQAVYFDTPDGRMVFAIPRDGKTYFGTTDTNYKSDTANPHMTAEDRSYLLEAANFMFPEQKLTEADVESSWAGLRPLIQQEGKSPSEISRRDEIFVSPSGLLSIAGGKLTGYRKMAETVVDKLEELLLQEGHEVPQPGCMTRTIPISGGDVGGSSGFPRFVSGRIREGVNRGFSEAEAKFLTERYGSNVDALFQLAEEARERLGKYGLPLPVAVQLMYAIDGEMAVKPADFFIRRTGDLFFNIAAVRKWKEPVTAAMAEMLGWSDDERASYAAELERQLAEAVEPQQELTNLSAKIPAHVMA
jgi:glycerol-3-phosphate dehydrogenase